MNPIAAARSMRDESEDADVRREACQNLRAWLGINITHPWRLLGVLVLGSAGGPVAGVRYCPGPRRAGLA